MPDILTGEITPELDAEVVVEPVEPVEPGVTDDNPTEDAAREQGWVPKEEWSGDPTQWAEPSEFLFRGQLYDRIKTESKQNRKLVTEVDELRTAITALGEHNSKLAKRDYTKAMNDLNTQKVEAIESRDGEAVVDIDQQIDELKELAPEEVPAAPTKPVEPAEPSAEIVAQMDSWKQSNSWYESTPALRYAADGIGKEYAENNPQATFEEVLDHVSKEIATNFSEKVSTPAAKPAVVTNTSAAPSTRQANRYSERDLSDEQRTIGATFVRSSVFENMQQYVDQLAEMGELSA